MSVKEREDREHWADGSVCHTTDTGCAPSWACFGLCSIIGMSWNVMELLSWPH